MCLLAAKEVPEQYHGAEASNCWLKLAEEFLEPADIDIEREGERMTVRVDFQRDRVSARVPFFCRCRLGSIRPHLEHLQR